MKTLLANAGPKTPSRYGVGERFFDHDVAAAFAVRGVKPTVHAPAKAVETMLLVAGIETGGENFANVGDAVAVDIFGVNQIGRGGDENAVAPGHHAIWKI